MIECNFCSLYQINVSVTVKRRSRLIYWAIDVDKSSVGKVMKLLYVDK